MIKLHKYANFSNLLKKFLQSNNYFYDMIVYWWYNDDKIAEKLLIITHKYYTLHIIIQLFLNINSQSMISAEIRLKMK